MATYDRINELKKIKSINANKNVQFDDLFLIDENGQSYLDYIINKSVIIYDNNLKKKITNDYDLLVYMFERGYFLDDYDNPDLLFDSSREKMLVELIIEKKPNKLGNMSLDIINRLFYNKNGKYLIEKIIEKDLFTTTRLIGKITNFDTLYNCLSNINRLDLMLFANENILLTKDTSGKPMLETLIDAGYKFDASSSSYRVAEILYNTKQYESLLKMDSKVLIDFPDRHNNYLNLLIQKYKSGESIPFENIIFNSNENRCIALVNIALLKNDISYKKPYTMFSFFDFLNQKPTIIHMLEMDRDLTIEFYGRNELNEQLKKYLVDVKEVDESLLDNFKIEDVFSYLPNKDKFKEDLLAGKITEINEEDIYREDLGEKLSDGKTILEYALIHGIKTYITSPKNIEELIAFVKYSKNYFSITEKLLYEPFDSERKVIDYLIESKKIDDIKYATSKDLRILDYCKKYNNYSMVGFNIIENLLIPDGNGNYPIEKYLDNDNFLECLKGYQIDDSVMYKLYEKGYKKILFNSSLEFLMNYPSKEHNYLQELIDEYKNGAAIKFENRSYKCDDKELMAKCYIQMANNGLIGYLDELNERELLDNGNSSQNLLYYLITFDKSFPLGRISKFDMSRSPQLFAQLKTMGVDDALFNVEYDKFNCDDICRKVYNDEYASGVSSPVEELLEELKQLFYNDGISDKELIDALIISYRYSTGVNPMFIQELQQLIQIKNKHSQFHYAKELDTGYFSKFDDGIFVGDTTISTLNHETGHAMHYYLTNDAVPDGYYDLLLKINSDETFIDRVEQYSKRFSDLNDKVKKSADGIVSKYISSDIAARDGIKINEFLSQEKEKLIIQCREKGYSDETLNIVLAGTFTVDEFLNQKSEIEKKEVRDLIMRYDYDAFIAIGDIIDAITNGKFRSDLLYNKNGELIKGAYGHGIRYYSRDNESRFCEMIANYVAIIKSKHSEEILTLLREIVGEELVVMLDEFYINKIARVEYENEKGVTK